MHRKGCQSSSWQQTTLEPVSSTFTYCFQALPGITYIPVEEAPKRKTKKKKNSVKLLNHRPSLVLFFFWVARFSCFSACVLRHDSHRLRGHTSNLLTFWKVTSPPPSTSQMSWLILPVDASPLVTVTTIAPIRILLLGRQTLRPPD